MASVIAWVDQATHGRASLGIARGDSALAHLGMAPMTIAQFDTYLGVVTRYLRGDTVSFEDLEPWRTSMRVTDVPLAEAPPESQLRWLPETRPVPITIYATGPRMIASAARFGDRILLVLGAHDERLKWAIGVARDACVSLGRDPDSIIFAAGMSVSVCDDVDLARNMVSNTVASSARFSSMHGSVVGPVSPEERHIYENIAKSYDMNKHNAHGSQTKQLTPEFVDKFAVVGPPQRCVERLQALRELGIDEFLIAPPYNDVDPVHAAKAYDRLIAEVLPAVRGSVRV
jgi:5,10-methylenetetrahydromethanopterin reductase